MNLSKVLLFLISFILLVQCNNSKEKNIEFHFSSFDKTKIAFTDEGDGEVILLIHGFISNGSSWNKAAIKKRLLENGYRVIVPDLRGNGRSGKPRNPEAYQNDAEVDDLIALANHLKLEKYKAIGYSRGTIVLAKLLTKEGRITKAALGGMGLDFSNPDWDRRIAFADAFSGRVNPNTMTEGAIKYARSIRADLKILGHLQDFQPVTSKNEIQNIRIQTLVICGDRDKDNGDPEDLHKQLANSKFVIVEGDHNNTYKQENFAEAVLGFLKP